MKKSYLTSKTPRSDNSVLAMELNQPLRSRLRLPGEFLPQQNARFLNARSSSPRGNSPRIPFSHNSTNIRPPPLETKNFILLQKNQNRNPRRTFHTVKTGRGSFYETYGRVRSSDNLNVLEDLSPSLSSDRVQLNVQHLKEERLDNWIETYRPSPMKVLQKISQISDLHSSLLERIMTELESLGPLYTSKPKENEYEYEYEDEEEQEIIKTSSNTEESNETEETKSENDQYSRNEEETEKSQAQSETDDSQENTKLNPRFNRMRKRRKLTDEELFNLDPEKYFYASIASIDKQIHGDESLLAGTDDLLYADTNIQTVETITQLRLAVRDLIGQKDDLDTEIQDLKQELARAKYQHKKAKKEYDFYNDVLSKQSFKLYQPKEERDAINREEEEERELDMMYKKVHGEEDDDHDESEEDDGDNPNKNEEEKLTKEQKLKRIYNFLYGEQAHLRYECKIYQGRIDEHRQQQLEICQKTAQRKFDELNAKKKK